MWAYMDFQYLPAVHNFKGCYLDGSLLAHVIRKQNSWELGVRPNHFAPCSPFSLVLSVAFG